MVENRVLAHKGNMFNDRLCDEQSIERVTMVERQGGNLRRVSRLNREDRHSIRLNLTVHEFVQRFVEPVLAQTDLDGDFP